MADRLPLWLRLARLLMSQARPSFKDAVLGVLVFVFSAVAKVRYGDLGWELTWQNAIEALFPIVAALMVFLIVHTVGGARLLIHELKAEQVVEVYDPYPSLVLPERITATRKEGVSFFRVKTISLAALFIAVFVMFGFAAWELSTIIRSFDRPTHSSVSVAVAEPSPSSVSLASPSPPLTATGTPTPSDAQGKALAQRIQDIDKRLNELRDQPSTSLRRRALDLSKRILLFADERRRNQPPGPPPFKDFPENVTESEKQKYFNYTKENRLLYVRDFSTEVVGITGELKNQGIDTKYLDYYGHGQIPVVANLVVIEDIAAHLARAAAQLKTP